MGPWALARAHLITHQPLQEPVHHAHTTFTPKKIMNIVNGQCVRASDGLIFNYSVDVTPWFWSAHVRDGSDQIVGTPKLGVFGRRLSSEELRSCAVRWIECVIREGTV